MILMVWISSACLILSLTAVSMFFVVVEALLWLKYDETKEFSLLVTGIIISVVMVFWFFFFVQICRKIELHLLLFKIASNVMKNNLRIMIYGLIVSKSMFRVSITNLFLCRSSY